MIDWIDIQSPFLTKAYEDWTRLRGNALIPQVDNFNHFVGVWLTDLSASIIVRSKACPSFHGVGKKLGTILPHCERGTTFEQIHSAPTRVLIVSPFFRVLRSKQPFCRRTMFSTGETVARAEQLLLPFATARMDVCMVHVLFDRRDPSKRVE